MSDSTRFALRSVSVVVTAQFHNPSILNPDFLVTNDIVPEDWKVTDTLTTPPVSVVRYDNGVEWALDQSRMTVTERAGPDFQDVYHVHEPVIAYVKRLAYVPYRTLGLNCLVSRQQADSRRWLIERFGTNWLADETSLRAMTPKFSLDAEDAVCHISAEPSDDGDGFNADCNVHHPGPLSSERICAAIRRWPERQKDVLAALAMLFGD